MIFYSNDYYILSNGASPLFYYGDAELWEADSEIDSDNDIEIDWDIEIIIEKWWELEDDLDYNITEI